MTENGKDARLILASGSPRRQQLLREGGFTFTVHAPDIDEDDIPPGTLPLDAALLLARGKGNAIAPKFPDAFVLAADTVVALGDRIIGKPDDPMHAKEMLRLLEGTTHLVITGVYITCIERRFTRATRVMSAVRMQRLSEAKIERYLQTGAWRGKAGAYGLQDDTGLVTCVAGCPTNVIGLPMPATRELLAEAGIQPSPRN